MCPIWIGHKEHTHAKEISLPRQTAHTKINLKTFKRQSHTHSYILYTLKQLTPLLKKKV